MTQKLFTLTEACEFEEQQFTAGDIFFELPIKVVEI